jgi:hypothetical protein
VQTIPLVSVRFGLPRGLRAAKWVGFVLALFTRAYIRSMGDLGIGLGVLMIGLWVLLTFTERLHRGGHVLLEHEGLRVRTGGFDRTFRRSEVIAGHPVRRENALVLRLRNGGEVLLNLPEATAPEGILEHMEVAVTQRAYTAPLRGPLGAFLKGFFALGGSITVLTIILQCLHAIVTPAVALIVIVVGPLAITAFVLARFGFPRVVVGSDGIHVSGLRLRPVFVAFDQVAGARLETDGSQPRQVVVERKGQSHLILPTIGQTLDQVEALVERINHGITAHGERSTERLLVVLDRGNRSVAAWNEELRRLAVVGAGYRDQAFGVEDFKRVLADPAASVERRVGAALAMRSVDAAAPERIRAVAASSANESLRVALEAAADAEVDEEVIDKALRTRA